VCNPIWAIALTLATQTPTPAPQTWPDDRPITHSLQNLGHDLKALPSLTTGSLLLVGAGGIVVTHPLDQPIDRWVRRQPSSSLAAFGNHVGSSWVQGGAALTTWLVGKATGDSETAHIGSDLIRAQALNAVLGTPIKVLVDRRRPTGGRYSFPSGHTSATFATAAVLQEHFGWKAAIPGYAVAGLVGWSRIRSDNHWLSDVAFGAALGLVSGKTVTAGHRRRSWVVVPTRIRSGIAVYVIRQPRVAATHWAGGSTP
jgi:hypothetical protein